ALLPLLTLLRLALLLALLLAALLAALLLLLVVLRQLLQLPAQLFQFTAQLFLLPALRFGRQLLPLCLPGELFLPACQFAQALQGFILGLAALLRGHLRLGLVLVLGQVHLELGHLGHVAPGLRAAATTAAAALLHSHFDIAERG